MNRDDVLDIARKIVEKETEVRALHAELDSILGLATTKSPSPVRFRTTKKAAVRVKKKAVHAPTGASFVMKRGPGRPRLDDGKGLTFAQRLIDFMVASPGPHTAPSLIQTMGLDRAEISSLGSTLSRLALRKDIRRLGNGMYAAPLKSKD